MVNLLEMIKEYCNYYIVENWKNATSLSPALNLINECFKNGLLNESQVMTLWKEVKAGYQLTCSFMEEVERMQ